MKKAIKTLKRHKNAIILILVFTTIPLIKDDSYVLQLLTLVFFWAIFALSWNLLASSGQVSLGHSAFLGLGAYAVIILEKLNFSVWFGLCLAPFIVMFFGAFVGIVCVRLREWFLALATLSLIFVLDAVFGSWKWVGGRLGVYVGSIASGNHFYLQQYYFFLACLILLFFAIQVIMKSKYGIAFSAIRQNPLEAELIGINVVKYRLLAFMISAFFAGLAGAIYAQYMQYIDPRIFGLDRSIMPMVMALVGGKMTVEGPIVGAALIYLIDQGLKFIPIYKIDVLRMIIIGLILALFVILIPGGVTPSIYRLFSFFKRKIEKTRSNSKRYKSREKRIRKLFLEALNRNCRL